MIIENNANYTETQNSLRSKIYKEHKFISDFNDEKIFIDLVLIFTLIYLFLIFKLITQESSYPSFELLSLLGLLTFALIAICLLTIF